jgi:hypothetical protein
MIVEIQVTNEDINCDVTEQRCETCPLARAISRVLNPRYGASVGLSTVFFWDTQSPAIQLGRNKTDWATFTLRLPEPARLFRQLFDNRGLRPISRLKSLCHGRYDPL